VEAGVPARYGAFIGVSIVITFGVAFGMVLLIVPGILLGLRWALANNFTLTREMGVRQALFASVEATEGHRVAIFGAYVVYGLGIYVPYFVLAEWIGSTQALGSVDPWSGLRMLRIAWASFAGIAGLALGIGLFSALVGRNGDLREIFA